LRARNEKVRKIKLVRTRRSLQLLKQLMLTRPVVASTTIIPFIIQRDEKSRFVISIDGHTIACVAVIIIVTTSSSSSVVEEGGGIRDGVVGQGRQQLLDLDRRQVDHETLWIEIVPDGLPRIAVVHGGVLLLGLLMKHRRRTGEIPLGVHRHQHVVGDRGGFLLDILSLLQGGVGRGGNAWRQRGGTGLGSLTFHFYPGIAIQTSSASAAIPVSQV
jgi:hypothetical protein